MQDSIKSDYEKRKAKPNLNPFMAGGKIPPQSPEMEQSVLGIILNEQHALESVSEILQPDNFYLEHHTKIYENLIVLAQQGQPTDIISLTEQLRKVGELESIGGIYYLQQLTNTTVSSAPLIHHALKIKEKFLKREQIKLAGELYKMGYEENDVFDDFETMEQALFDLSNISAIKNISSIAKVADKVMKNIADVRAADNELTGVPTGFTEIDHKTNGWQDTDLIIIAARPSVGKTAFSLNLALNAATDIFKPTPVALFNLEMQDMQLVKRGLSAQSKVPLENINRPKSLSDGDMISLHDAKKSLFKTGVFIEDTPALTTSQLRSKMRRYIKKHKIGLVIIDYLQLMGSSKKTGNREQEISQISRDLKVIAKELKVPIIALSQLNRDIEKRASKEPNLSDLRESGAIEQDADLIMFLYKPSDEKIAEDAYFADQIMVSCKKHRNGDLFETQLKFNKSIQQFSDNNSEPAPFGGSKMFIPGGYQIKTDNPRKGISGDYNPNKTFEADKNEPF